MKFKMVVLALLVVGATVVQAETHKMGQMSMQVSTIDGSKTPGAIPDVLAARLWLNASTAPDDPVERQQQEQNAMSKMKLTTMEVGGITAILERYRIEARELIAQHNKDADAQAAIDQSSPKNEAAFWANWQLLVTQTMDQINGTLNDTTRFPALLSVERAGIRASAYDFFLGASAARLRAEGHMVAGKAQMGGGIQAQYSAYITRVGISYKGDGNPNNIKFYFQIYNEGDTYVEYPRMLPPNTIHASHSRTQLGSHGSDVLGSSGFPTNYISSYNSLTLSLQDFFSGGGFLVGYLDTYVYCSYISNVFWDVEYLSNGNYPLELSVGTSLTYTYDAGGPSVPDSIMIGLGYPKAAYYYQNLGCTAQTSPPDVTVYKVTVYDGVRRAAFINLGLAVYINKIVLFSSTSWWMEIPAFFGENIPSGLAIQISPTSIPADCTNWIKGYPPKFTLDWNF
jgi:hypothetical protein